MLESTEDIKSVPSENPQPEKIGRKFEARERTFLLRALIFSVLLHGGIFVKFIMPEETFADVRDKIAIYVRSRMRIAEKKAYVERLRASKEMQADSDGFFLNSEFYEGGMNENELNETKNEIAGFIKEFQEMTSKEEDPRKVLRQLAKKQRTIKTKNHSSYLSRLLLKFKGNCEAKAKLMASIVKKVYPNMPVKYQFYRKLNQNHMRVIVGIEGQWFALEEDDLVPVNQDDLKGTVLADTSIFVDTYLGKKPSINAINMTDNPNPLEMYTTDTYFSLLPADLGVRLRDIDADTNKPDELKVSLASQTEIDEKNRIDKEAEEIFKDYCIDNAEDREAIRDFIKRKYKILALKRNPDKSWLALMRYTSTEGSMVRECETWLPIKGKNVCGQKSR